MRPPSWLFCVVLSSMPLGHAMLGFTWQHGFLGLPRFGEVFRSVAMEPVKQYAPPAKPNDIGYDGQFYAQIALDPTLRDPSLRMACDNVSYRAKRIALPSLAFGLGAGQPWAVLQIYSILNVVFWFLLLFVLVREFGVETWNARLLMIGILWNAGCLISIGRALTDLPALSLGVLAICLRPKKTNGSHENSTSTSGLWLLSSAFASLSVLTKETALLSILSFFDCSTRRRWWQGLIAAGVILIPIALWLSYVRYQVGNDSSGFGNFAPPFYGFFHKLWTTWREAIANFPRIPLLEMIAPWTIVVQIVFLIRQTSWRSRWWQFGIGFAVLAIVIGPWVWATQSAYSRCLLPLAVSFNVLLSQSNIDRSRHWKWWTLGNLGFLDRGAIGLFFLLIVNIAWGWYSRPKEA